MFSVQNREPVQTLNPTTHNLSLAIHAVVLLVLLGTCMYVCMYVCVYTHIYICIYVYCTVATFVTANTNTALKPHCHIVRETSSSEKRKMIKIIVI